MMIRIRDREAVRLEAVAYMKLQEMDFGGGELPAGAYRAYIRIRLISGREECIPFTSLEDAKAEFERLIVQMGGVQP